MNNQAVISTNGKAVDESAIGKFKSHLRGTIVRPGEHDYDDARKLWNGCFDKLPALIARCTCAEDVARTLRCRTNLP
ncbi:MAG: hypothetical protein WCA22_12420 [Candidatus Binatus sp.]